MKMMNLQQRTDNQPRRMPLHEVMTDMADKGRKHEAFESGGTGRSLARAIRFDRKR